MSKLQIQIEKTETSSLEVEVPSFFRSKDEKDWLAILDEKTMVNVYRNGDLTIITNASTASSTSKQRIAHAASTFHGCTEAEFLQAFDAAVESISLHPKIAV